MNKVIELLMEELGVGICEDFRVKPSVAGQSEYKSIYHFDELGALRRDDGIPADSVLGFLARGKLRIEKVKPKGRYIPKYGEYYWYIPTFGGISWKTYEDEFDEYVIKHNLVFRTEEEAEDYRWFLEQVDKYKKEFEIGKLNHYFYYIFIDKRIGISWNDVFKEYKFYFGSTENIQEFRNVVGDERIKKYMFNIWE
ncbi:hypothetical protein ACR75P_08335 [Faecalicoccus pleomorphus]|uniref:hypothetical protein n=1 Tax=Faecalicoccus pleomorphus TaxID=1323 RepID=UPI003DA39662